MCGDKDCPGICPPNSMDKGLLLVFVLEVREIEPSHFRTPDDQLVGFLNTPAVFVGVQSRCGGGVDALVIGYGEKVVPECCVTVSDFFRRPFAVCETAPARGVRMEVR
jgi:hypothetical protein